jgi:hypothetical protein
MGKSFESSWVVPSIRRVLLVIEGTIIVIVPLIMSFLLTTLTLLMPVVNLVVCISTAYDITQISVILIPPSATFLRWSDTAGRVPTWTLSVVKLVIPYFIITVKDRVNHSCCVQHHLEPLYMLIDFFIIFRQVRCELVDEHP